MTVDDWSVLRGADLEDAMLTSRWYAHPNDLVGGWCVTFVDLPPSQGAPSVADFLSERAAQHIVDLHNATLGE